MLKIKTSELTGAALDWAVAQCEGYDTGFRQDCGYFVRPLSGKEPPELLQPYSTDWAQGGPIKTKNLIATSPKWQNAGYKSDTGYWYWLAYMLGPENIDDSFEQSGESELIAAMRCYVASELGDEVEIPEALK